MTISRQMSGKRSPNVYGSDQSCCEEKTLRMIRLFLIHLRQMLQNSFVGNKLSLSYTQTLTRMHSHTRILKHTKRHTLIHTHAQALSISNTHIQTLTQTHTHTHPLSLTHTLTPSLSHKLTPSFSLTHPHSLSHHGVISISDKMYSNIFFHSSQKLNSHSRDFSPWRTFKCQRCNSCFGGGGGGGGGESPRCC